MKKILNAYKKDLIVNNTIFIVTLLLGISFILCFTFWWNSHGDSISVYKSLSNSSLIVWGFYLSTALLMVINRLGFFDTLVYGFNYLGHGIFRPNVEKKYVDLIDYKDKKNVKRTSKGYYYIPFLMTAVLFVIPFIVFNTIFNNIISNLAA